MSELTHVDLFSGIGGFALAAKVNGIRTIQFVEINKRCRDFLSRAWPGVPIHDDVLTFRWGVGDTTLPAGNDGESGGVPGQAVSEPRDTASGHPVYLLTAGVPCQPASRAGKQRGADDDRWLWPAAIAALRSVQPTWALFENPLGIGDVAEFGVQPPVDNEGNPVGVRGDVFTRRGRGHLDAILEEIEEVGYSVQPFSIPACAVGAPHRRERYWIVAHRNGAGCEGADAREERDAEDGLRSKHRQGDMADTECERRQWRGAAPRQAEGALTAVGGPGLWSSHIWLPCADRKLRRAPDNSIGMVDGLHRSLLGALGNSIVPQVAERIIRAMIQVEET